MIKRFLQLLILALLTAQIAVFLARTHWFLELFTHYPHYYAITATLLIPFLTWKRMWKSTIIIALILSINLATISPYLESKSPDLTQTPNISILASNFLYKNTEFGEFSELIDKEDPDIFIIHEASTLWQKDPKSQYQDYPYQEGTEERGIHGIFLASKIPGTYREIPLGSHTGLEFQPETYDFKILAVHPEAPITAAYAEERNAQFADITTYTQNSSTPVIIIGDFNCTPFSPHFQDLLATTLLRDARLGFGFIPTWHAHNPLFRIPIDHALVSPEIDVLDFRTTQKITSDHWPILAKISLP